jgi:hypothetical protein
MLKPSDCQIELNSIMRGMCVDRLSGMIPKFATQAQLPQIARRCLLQFWKDDDVDFLVPGHAPIGQQPVPDEVVVRTPDGRALYRRTIVEEKIERWFAASSASARVAARIRKRNIGV